MYGGKTLKKLLNKKVIIIVALILAVVIAVVCFKGCSKKETKANATELTVAEVTKGNLVVQITGSGTIEANDQYDITSVVDGDVLADFFEEGDILEEGAIMYQIDSKSASNTISRSENSLERAKVSYDNAVKDYNNLTVTAPIDGVITAVNAKAGQSAGNGSALLTITDTETMVLRIYFNANDAKNLYSGAVGTVYLDNSSKELEGIIDRVSTGSVESNGVQVSQVTIKVKNPGTIKEGDTATAIINGVACNRAGTFEVNDTKNVTAKVSGDIDKVHVVVGDKVQKGQALAIITSDNVSQQLRNTKLAYDDASTSVSDAYDILDNYTITAPISGTVLSKTVKAGDTLSRGSSGATAMAIIADMSKVKFTISVDELDISKMKEGQKVLVTADALENQRYEGYIDNVSIVGTTSNGVTTYPITVVIEEYGELIPGMNVDATITVSEATDTLKIPLSAVQRGNIVYVHNDDVKEEQKNTMKMPEGMKKPQGAEKEGKNTEKKGMPNMTSRFEGYTPVRVEVGLSNSDEAEIKSGLYEGQRVAYIAVQATNTNNMFGGMPMGGGMNMGGNRPQGTMPGGMR